jgi:class 3 adenylate cyclase
MASAGHEIGFGIGVAHGFATLGTIGFEGRFDYAAIGTVSNVASRLCDEAKPGQILISPRVLIAVEDRKSPHEITSLERPRLTRPSRGGTNAKVTDHDQPARPFEQVHRCDHCLRAKKQN